MGMFKQIKVRHISEEAFEQMASAMEQKSGEVVRRRKPGVSEAGNVVLIYKSACRMCHGGCGVFVHVKGGRVVKIEGNPDSPVSRGRLCSKGLASIDHLYNPDRITYPMKRAGERGEGRWTRITWDETYNILAGKIKELQDKYGPETIAVAHGTGRYYFPHVVRFTHALGSPNWIEPGSANCFAPRIIMSAVTYGDLILCDYGYNEAYPECLLCWGKHPYVSGSDGESQFRVKSALQRGLKLIVVDPRQTEMARMADIWLPVRPGTDAAVALAFSHVIIEEKLYDRAFVDKWTVGFDRLKERVKSCTPEWAAQISWVEEDDIRAAARMYASIKPAAMTWGNALEHNPNAFQNARAVGILPALTGNVDLPGGNILGEHAFDEVDMLVDHLSDEIKDKRLGADTYRMLCGRDSQLPSANIFALFKAIRTEEPYPVKALLLFGNNGLLSFANTERTYQTFQSLDFMSVMELYMTPTAAMADLILPGATWLEADEISEVPLVANNYALAQQKVVQIGECKQPEEVFIELARRLGLSAGTESLEKLFDTQLRRLGITFKELKQKGHAGRPVQYRKHETNGIGFRTPSGKIELYSSVAEMLGYDPLPDYREPPESPYSRPDLAKKYPYVLSTGGRIQQYFNSEYRNIPSLRRQHPWPMVEINHETAGKLGIRSGDWVWIESPRGRIKQKARLTNQHPGVVHVSYGWWYPEMPGPVYGVWESNANVLTNDEPPHCPAMGTYQLSGLLCTIYKVGEGEATPQRVTER
jgi:thiosulfate reductase / polysulfide reductase chain A